MIARGVGYNLILLSQQRLQFPHPKQLFEDDGAFAYCLNLVLHLPLIFHLGFAKEFNTPIERIRLSRMAGGTSIPPNSRIVGSF